MAFLWGTFSKVVSWKTGIGCEDGRWLKLEALVLWELNLQFSIVKGLVMIMGFYAVFLLLKISLCLTLNAHHEQVRSAWCTCVKIATVKQARQDRELYAFQFRLWDLMRDVLLTGAVQTTGGEA